MTAATGSTPAGGKPVMAFIGADENGVPTSSIGVGSSSGNVDLALHSGLLHGSPPSIVATAYVIKNIAASGTGSDVTLTVNGDDSVTTYVILTHEISAHDDITINVNSTGRIVNPAGLTTQVITAHDITLNVPAGNIGTASVPIKTNLTAADGTLDAGALDSIFLTETDADMRVGGIASTTGDVTLATLAGSILDASVDPAGDVSGTNITLTAQGGGIGTPTSDLDLDSSYSGAGLVRVTASQDVWLNETVGDLTLDRAVSTSGGVGLTAAGQILDDLDSGAMDISGSSAVLMAGSGVGTSSDALETGVDRLEASGGTGGIWIDNTGGLTIGGITAVSGLSAGGPIVVTASSPLTVEENVESTTSNVSLTATESSGQGDDLLVTSGATITAAGWVSLQAGDNLRMDTGTAIMAGGMVSIAGDHQDADGSGTIIELYGEIHGPAVEVMGNEHDDVVVVTNVTSGSPTRVMTGAGSDTVNVGSHATPTSNSGGTLNSLSALVTIEGGPGTDQLSVDDTGDNSPNTGLLTATRLMGLGMGSADQGEINPAGGIAYTELETLTISLGSGSDTFTVADTNAGTTTTLNSNAGPDTVNVQATQGATTIDAGEGDDAINVSSDAPGNTGTLDGIAGALHVQAGSGSNRLHVSDIADTTPDGTSAAPVVITDHSISGFSPAAITYAASGGSFAGGITIEGGSGGNTIDIQSTHSTPDVLTITLVNTGQGADRVTVSETDPEFLVVNGQDSNDWIDASASTQPVTLFGGAGDDTLIGGSGGDTLFGDGGRVRYAGSHGGRDIVLGAVGLESNISNPGIGETPKLIATVFGEGEGADSILGNDGEDIILGGSGADAVSAGGGNDIVLGDNGQVVFTIGGLVAAIETTDLTFGGADSLDGDAGDDILHGQLGDDQLHGGSGDDELFGELGNDALWGDEGHDIMLGDVGFVTRAYNADGTPRLNPDGSWHKDVLLTDLARVTGRVDLDGLTWGDLDRSLAEALVNADLLLLAGAYNADGSLHLLPQVPASCWHPHYEWDTELLLLTLLPDGDDALDGGTGNDALYGQRGNDTLTGGAGEDFLTGGAGHDLLDGGSEADWLVGDQATVLTEDGRFPNVARGLQLLPGGIEAEAGISLLGQGTTLLPMATVVPGHDVDPAQGVLAQLHGVPGAPSENVLSRADGTYLVPFATLVPGFAGHLDLVAGNDTLSGGTGDDVLTGDNATVLAPRLTFSNALMEHALSVTADFLDAADDLGDLVRVLHYEVGALDPCLHIWTHSVVVDQTLSIGNDLLDGAAGNDNLTGDDRTAIATALTVTVGQLDSLEGLVAGFDHIEAELEGAGRELIDVEHHLRDEVAQIPCGRYWKNVLVHHIDQLILGNDQLTGGEGNDLLVGDQQLHMAPTVTVVAGGTRPHGPEHRWHDDDWHDGSHHHHRNWHDDFWHYHEHDGWTFGAGDLVLLGGDTLDGGAGNDVLYGDSLAMNAPAVVLEGSVSWRDAGWAEHEAEEVLNELTELGGHHQHHGWFHHHYDTSQDGYQITGGGDHLLGGDGGDLLFGQGDRDTLDGGTGADWLVGGHDPDTLYTGVNKKEDKLSSGDNDSRGLRENLQSRLVDWSGQYKGFGSAPGLGFPSPWAQPFELQIADQYEDDNAVFVLMPQPARRRC